jgi:IclR family KDG regulon transcriptional repressor
MDNNSKLQNNKRSRNIKSVSKAVSVLKTLSLGHSKLSDIAREVKISKNGVFRLLYSLKQEDLVAQDPVTREYFMGTLLFELSANPLKSNQHLISCSYHEIEDLWQTVGETISLDIKFGVEKIVLRRLLGTHNVSFVGQSSPVDHLWYGATGKVLLAQLNEHELEMILEHITLVPLTPFTITDKQVFRQEIAKTKERGYATSYSECELGAAGIAVPVEGYIVPVSLAIMGPEDRLATRAIDYVDKLKQTAGKISQYLSTSLRNNVTT